MQNREYVHAQWADERLASEPLDDVLSWLEATEKRLPAIVDLALARSPLTATAG